MTKDLFDCSFKKSCCIVPLDVLIKAYIGGVKCNYQTIKIILYLTLCRLKQFFKSCTKKMMLSAFALFVLLLLFCGCIYSLSLRYLWALLSN